jgi:hypothetical protein
MSLLAACVQPNAASYYFPLGTGSNVSGAVTQVVAGTGISVSPGSGVGAVTIANTGVITVSAGSNVTLTGTAANPIIAANVPAGTSVTTFQASASLVYTNAIATAGPNVATLATITLSQAVNYAQITWGANGVAGANPEVVSVGGDAATGCFIYLSASTGVFNPATSFGAFQFVPKDGTGETSVKLPSTIAQVPGVTLPPMVMSATSPTPTTTWYMSMYNVAYASNVYIQASTSVGQAYSIVGMITN